MTFSKGSQKSPIFEVSESDSVALSISVSPDDQKPKDTEKEKEKEKEKEVEKIETQSPQDLKNSTGFLKIFSSIDCM